MKTVNKIHRSRLSNANFYQFIENIVKVVSSEPITKNLISTLNDDLHDLQNAFKKEQLTEETKKIVALDLLRDRAFMKIKLLVEAYQYEDENPELLKASQELFTLIKLYGSGKLIRFDYNKETASISNFVNDARNKFASQLEKLGLSASLNYLEICNNDFKNYYATRNDVASQFEDFISFSRLRIEVNEHYKTFAKDIESLQRFIPENAAIIEEVINRVNVEIDKFKLLI